ncbi:hypothetical protein D3C76_1622820 [compost metagenome]
MIDSETINRVPNQEVQLWIYNIRVDRLYRTVAFKGLHGRGSWTNPAESVPRDFDFTGPIDVVAEYRKVVGTGANYSVNLLGQMITT